MESRSEGVSAGRALTVGWIDRDWRQWGKESGHRCVPSGDSSHQTLHSQPNRSSGQPHPPPSVTLQRGRDLIALLFAPFAKTLDQGGTSSGTQHQLIQSLLSEAWEAQEEGKIQLLAHDSDRKGPKNEAALGTPLSVIISGNYNFLLVDDVCVSHLL